MNMTMSVIMDSAMGQITYHIPQNVFLVLFKNLSDLT